MSDRTITDRALLRIIDRLELSAIVDRIAEQTEPRGGWPIGLDLATRRVRELHTAGLIRQVRLTHAMYRYWTLTDAGRAVAEAPPTENELSSLARLQLLELQASGAPDDVVAELTADEFARLEQRALPPPAASGRRARSHQHARVPDNYWRRIGGDADV